MQDLNFKMGRISVLITIAFLLASCVAPAPMTLTSTPLVATPELPSIVVSTTPTPAKATSLPVLDTNTPVGCLTCSTETATMTTPIPVTATFQAYLSPVPSIDSSIISASNQVCPPDVSFCILDGHFLMQRPISSDYNESVDNTYRYGTTQLGKREPHHGVEFPNQTGTPVLAAADGIVVFAGNDKQVALAWVPDFYGNVVVIAHQFPSLSQLVFSLYGHLSAFNVSVGQQVKVGDQIGQVGSTGKAIGSHLHFEVRLGNNDYLSNRNPELWLVPLDDTGVLAGRIESINGNMLSGIINVQRINHGVLNSHSVTSLVTYDTREIQPVNGDDAWRENFAAGELPLGDYRLSMVYNGAVLEQVVQILPGKLTFVRFVIK